MRGIFGHHSSDIIFRDQTEQGHGLSMVLEMARVRHNGESSLIDAIISNQTHLVQPIRVRYVDIN